MISNEFAERIVARSDVHENINELMHGYVVVLANKVWRDKDGMFIFQTEEKANSAFYRDMRDELARQYHIDNNPSGPNGRVEWNDFKRKAGFRIVHV